MFALTLPKRLPNFCSAIRATLGQRQIRQSPGFALNAHSGNEWGKILVLPGYTGHGEPIKHSSTPGCETPEQDVWAPPFGRRRLGAAVWAHGRLGAGRLGADPYGRGNRIL